VRRVGGRPGRSDTGQVTEYRRALWPKIAMTTLGIAAAASAAMWVIQSGTAATAGEGRSAPRTVVATVGPETPNAAPQAVTVTMSPGAEVPVRVDAAPMAAAQPKLDLRQISYTIAGNQRPNDPVTVVYADETGALRTVENVTLPWSMTMIPNLPVNYVTANSRGSQLNCWITDAAGATVVSQTDFGISTTCNR
jgi:hypothetical protein